MHLIKAQGAGGEIWAAAADLFGWASTWPLGDAGALAPEWAPVVQMVASYADQQAQAPAGASMAQAAPGKLDPRRAIVLFSGGKDSLAVALSLQAAGVAPCLLHVKGLNGSAYAHEAAAAAAVAEAAGLPFRVVTAKLHGKSAHTENPVKNVMLLGLGAAFALRWRAGVVAMGVLKHDTAVANVRCGLSDHPAIAAAGAAAIEAAAPGLRVMPAMIEDDCDAYARVWKMCPDAIPAISSCMTGARFKRSLRAKNEARFGIELLPGRCGSCYKCAFELIATHALAGRQMDPRLADHCVEKLRRGVQLMTGAAALPSRADAAGAFLTDAIDWRRALGAVAL